MMNCNEIRRITRSRTAAGAIAVVVAAATGVTACGSDKATSHGTSAAIGQSELLSLHKYVAQAQEPPAWHPPGPAVDGKSALAGKTIVTFPISSEIDACNSKGQQGYFDSEAQALGAKVIPLQSNTGPAGWQANLSQALTAKADAVVMLCGPTAAAIAPQLTALSNAHIPVVDGNYNQTAGNSAFPTTGLDAESGVNTVEGVQTDLADALINLKGKAAHVLFLDSSQVAQDQGASQGLRAAIKKWCPKTCTIGKSENFGTQDWSGPKETTEVTSDLQADPKINTVIVTFDGMGDGIESTVQSAASSHKGLAMYAWGGGLAEIKAIGNGGTYIGDSGPDEKWDAYNQLDQTIRLLSGKPAAPVGKEIAPNLFFTKANAKIFSVGGKGTEYSDAAYSKGAFINDFLTLWGVK